MPGLLPLTILIIENDLDNFFVKSHTTILISKTFDEISIAVQENKTIKEIWFDRASQTTQVGQIYLGKIRRVLPGKQAAFVDIGFERTAFLSLGKSKHLYRQFGALESNQMILVQVAKDAYLDKGATLTQNIAIAGKYLVLLPSKSDLCVSSAIRSFDAIKSLKEECNSFLKEKFSTGCVLRSAANRVSVEVLREEYLRLNKSWERVLEQAKKKEVALLLKPVSLLEETVQNHLSAHRLEILTHDKRIFEHLKTFLRKEDQLMPDYVDLRILEASDIFFKYGVEEVLFQTLSRRVSLPSGGYLIFDQTEAMMVIDVNTGADIRNSLSQSIMNVNLEAAKIIAHQIRLRNLSGTILIDFIPLKGKSEKMRVLEAMRGSVRKDKLITSVTGLGSPLELVLISRQRQRKSLSEVLCSPCQACQKSAYHLSFETIIYRLYRDIIHGHDQLSSLRQEVSQIACLVYISPSLSPLFEEERINSLSSLLEINITKQEKTLGKSDYEVIFYDEANEI